MSAMDLIRAYTILGVFPSASAHAIKQAHRRMLKRWHPDLYKPGTAGHDEATHMTRLINEAYATIQHAPLRYERQSRPSPQPSASRAASSPPREAPPRNTYAFPNPDRLEFGIRFVCGALFGILLGFRFVLFYSEDPTALALGVSVTAIALGLAAARHGDRFWHSLLRLWWLWS